MRLTSERNDGQYLKKIKSIDECLNKLGELEDIEEELGMSLNVFIRCLILLDENNFRPVSITKVGNEDFYLESITPVRFVVDMKNKMFVELDRPDGYEEKLRFADYGKTWALTKEELE